MSKYKRTGGKPIAMAQREQRTETPRNYICYVCQTPVAPAESVRWRGEPVHSDCVASGDADNDDS